MTDRPERSSTRAPDGAVTERLGPIALMTPPSMTIVWSSTAGAPVPSITRTCCSAIAGASTEMNSCVTCGSARRTGGGCCAVPGGCSACAVSQAASAATTVVVVLVMGRLAVFIDSSLRLDAQHRAVVFVGQQIEQTVRTLPHLTDALAEFAEERFTAHFLHLRVEDDPFEMTGAGDLAGAHRAGERVAFPAREAIAGVHRQPRRRDRWDPRHDRRLQAFTGRVL